MKSNHSFRSSKLCRALLILLLMVVPVQWSMAQLNLNTPHTTLKSIIQQIQAQSKFQFFYDDKLSDISVEPLSLRIRTTKSNNKPGKKKRSADRSLTNPVNH